MGMLPVQSKEIYPIMSFINKTSSDELVLDSLFSSKEKREIGYVLRMESHTDNDEVINANDDKPFYHIIPIIGKTNKSVTLLNANIEEYNTIGGYHINKDESTKRLLDALAEIDNDSNDPMEFQLKKKAFDCLVKEKFVFCLKSKLYNIKKSSLQAITLSPLSLDVVFNVIEDADYINADMKLKIGNELFNYSDIDTARSDNEICVINDVYYFVKNYKVSQYLANYPGNLKMVNSYKDEFFDQIGRSTY